MKKLVLIFPDTYSMAAFILERRTPGMEAYSVQLHLSASLTEREIAIACTGYGAKVKPLMTASST